MEEQAPYAVVTAAVPAAIAPYAGVLRAQQFLAEDWAPSASLACLYTSWRAGELLWYFCDLVVADDGQVHASLVRKQAETRAFRLFHWMRVESPAGLTRLLAQCVALAEAQQSAAADWPPAEPPRPAPPCPGLLLEPLPGYQLRGYQDATS